MLDAIPSAKQSAVRAALAAAFATDLPDAPPVRMAGGMSGAALYRIRVGGIAYILRLEPDAAGPFNDPVRAHLCMRRAAEACLAPTVRFADANSGVVIMDLIPERPLADYPCDRDALLTELAQSVRLLHETEAFPPVVDYLQGMDTLIGWFRQAGLSTPEAEELVDRFTAFRQTYRTPPEDLVSSHNDLNAKNVLYDGRRLWLIDWDAAFLADRYVDLAAAANWFTQRDDEADLILATYFRADPTPAQRARLYLMRQVNLMFYGVMFAVSAAEGTPRKVDLIGVRPVSEMRAALGAGTLDLWQAGNRLAYGSALLAQALEGFRGAQFGRELARAA
jgi:aminoglycoside phosphotransferase